MRSALRRGAITRVVHGVYGAGGRPPSTMDILRATGLVTGGVLDAVATAQLLEWDGVERWGPHVLVAKASSGKRGWTRRVTELPGETVEVGQVQCLPAPETLRQLASVLDDTHWEQALEYCLRKQLVTTSEVGEWHHPVVRRVVKARGGLLVPPTESLLETLAVQLIRQNPSIPAPTRQLTIYDADGNFVARPDLCWPELGLFLELDGQGHKDQPVYDANRQTRLTIVTGWRCGRLTWDEVHDFPEATLRNIARLVTPITVS
ncbi:MAG TPA: DUF559 domain-containing protein [Acidimicrobiales bacterium]|nr:DUF559 domain-containing protein [Acidimicrobiales bacterium]